MKIPNLMVLIAVVMLSQTARPDILGGPITNSANGHFYYLLTTNTWSGAEGEAVSLGGHLVTINNAAENDWVCANFLNYAGASRALWIGLFQPPGSPEPSGGWVWSSGEPVTFTNWTPPGEPNNNSTHGPQDWAMIWPFTATNNTAPYRNGCWNDTWNLLDTGTVSAKSTYGLHGVVEINPPTADGAPTNTTISVAVEIGWPSENLRYYRVQWSSAIAPAQWHDLSGLVRGNGPTNYFYDTTRTADKRFYRVLSLP